MSTETQSGVVLTDAASSKVATLLQQEGRDDLALRIAVQPGGCSGLRYQLFFDERTLDGDTRLDFDGVTVVVDRMSGPYLGGATIDFVDQIDKQGFTIDNPNATGSCACGDSFHWEVLADQLDDTVWISSNVTVDDMLDGYRRGRFAMPYIVDDIYLWMSPKERAILPLDRLRVTRSLRQSTKRYTVTFDREFDAVLAQCANPARRGGWITELLAANYRTMFHSGYAHSVEVWDDHGRLAGGLFLVNVGGLVSGESMFHVGRDASKVALVALVQRLRQAAGPVLLDTQWRTDHLATLGVIEVPRKKYLTMLPELVNRPNVL